MTLTRSKPVLIVTGLTAALALASCAGSAKQKESDGAAGAGGMIAQLTFPSEADASVGSLANYNPYAPKPLTTSLAVNGCPSVHLMPCRMSKVSFSPPSQVAFSASQGVSSQVSALRTMSCS